MPRTPSPATLEREETRHAISLELNPNIDRAPAEVNNPCDSKLCIVLNHTFPKAPGQLTYSLPVDWSSSKSVSKLNRWRYRFFKYWFGQMPEEYRKISPFIRYREDEKLWLLRERDLEEGQWKPWEQTMKRFNEIFEKEERPRRTAAQLCNIYKHMIKSGVGVRGVVGGHEEDGEEDESELEEGEIREDRPSEQDWRVRRPWEL